MEQAIVEQPTFERSVCQSCFTGNYPIKPEPSDQMQRNE